MHSVDLVDRKLFEKAIGNHCGAAFAVLFGGLENKDGLAAEVSGIRKCLGGAEQHRCVAVVAAGVHDVLVGRCVLEGVELIYGESVHVGAQADAAFAVALPQHAADARLADAGVNVEAEFVQKFGDFFGCTCFLKTQFRVGVEIVTPCRHGVVEVPGAERAGGHAAPSEMMVRQRLADDSPIASLRV